MRDNNPDQVLLVTKGQRHLPLQQKIEIARLRQKRLVFTQAQGFTAGDHRRQVRGQRQLLVPIVNIAKTGVHRATHSFTFYHRGGANRGLWNYT